MKRFEELETMLISRDYPKNVIKAAIDRASKIDRKEALKRVVKNKNDRPIFAVTYHPALPGLSGMIQKQWKSMTRNAEAFKTFPKPPMVAYRQPANLKKTLVRTSLPPKNRAKRQILGTQRCAKTPCKMCNYVSKEKNFQVKCFKQILQKHSLIQLPNHRGDIPDQLH